MDKKKHIPVCLHCKHIKLRSGHFPYECTVFHFASVRKRMPSFLIQETLGKECPFFENTSAARTPAQRPPAFPDTEHEVDISV